MRKQDKTDPDSPDFGTCQSDPILSFSHINTCRGGRLILSPAIVLICFSFIPLSPISSSTHSFYPHPIFSSVFLFLHVLVRHPFTLSTHLSPLQPLSSPVIPSYHLFSSVPHFTFLLTRFTLYLSPNPSFPHFFLPLLIRSPTLPHSIHPSFFLFSCNTEPTALSSYGRNISMVCMQYNKLVPDKPKQF